MAAPLLAAIPAVVGAVARAVPMVASAAGRATASAASSAGAGTRVASMAGRAAEMGTYRAGMHGVNHMMQPRESRTGAFVQGAAGPATGGQYSMF